MLFFRLLHLPFCLDYQLAVVYNFIFVILSYTSLLNRDIKFAVLDTFFRYKPDNSGLVIAIWGKVCDCAKGTPDPRKMMNILETAMEHLPPSTVLVSYVC